MANTLAHKHYLRALSQWPKDLLRPEASFQAAMRRRLDRRIKPSQQQQQLQQDGKKSTGRAVLLDLNEKTELEQVNALYSLLEDRYKQKHPVTETFWHPASNPKHFSQLMAELEAAPRRSWLASWLNKWKGFLRFR